jgi:ubiquinone/menaquinone biosynthesis C-methylase UbiE/phosphatidylglycerophosphate synthase
MNFKEKFLRKLTKDSHKSFDKAKISPEFLTIFRIIFGIATALVLMQGIYIYSIIMLLLYQFILLLDYIDGPLARYQNKFSLKWVYIDRIFHYLVTALLLIGLSISTKDNILILISFISASSFIIVGLIDTKNSDIRLNKDLKSREIKKYENIMDLFIIESPFSLFFFLILFNLIRITIILYSLFYILGFIYKIIKMSNSRKTKDNIKRELSEQYYGKESKEYDKIRERDPRRAYVVKRQIEITKNFLDEDYDNILDVACGTGRFFYLYKGKIYGIDMSSDQLKEAKKKDKKAILKVCDAVKITYPSNKFDRVITSQFIMHTPEYKEIIKEMTRVTKKGGKIIIDFPNKYRISTLMTKIRIKLGILRYYNFFSLEDIKEIAKENNLEIEDIQSTVVISPIIFPRIFLSLSISLNKYLNKTFPNLTYVYYAKFRKK